jgi:hypothetical protein
VVSFVFLLLTWCYRSGKTWICLLILGISGVPTSRRIHMSKTSSPTQLELQKETRRMKTLNPTSSCNAPKTLSFRILNGEMKT